MPTMAVTKAVELTPEVAIEHLRAFASVAAKDPFPHPNGTLIRLHSEYAKSVDVIPDMPSLVLASSEKFPLALIAVCKKTGVTMILVTKKQILGVWE